MTISKAKRTINRDSVFRDVHARDDIRTPTQGLPKEETRIRQTAVWLGEDEIEWLDNQCRTIQRGGWRSITRSALIRALIKAASAHPVKLSGTTGEVEIAARLASR